MLKDYPNRILWMINTSCNLNCEYCFEKNTLQKGITNDVFFSVKQICEAFNNTNRKWLILISGGEPFLYPNIYDILTGLTINNHIQITTNLMVCDVEKLIDAVHPSKLLMISASYHVMTKRNQKEKNNFINKCIRLKNAGFNVLVNYVSYPPLLERIDMDYLELIDSGIENFSVLTFRGKYNGQLFPESYSSKQFSLIEKYAFDSAEMKFARGHTNFHSYLCEAGHSYFSMDKYGNIKRCGTINKPYGNLFMGTFYSDRKLMPCTVNECLDCYLGLVAVKRQKAGMIKMLLNKFYGF